MTRHSEIFYQQLLHGHINKRCKLEIPKNHPLQDFAVTGAGLKNRAYPLAITITHNQLQKLPAIIDCKSGCATHFIETLASIPFLDVPVIKYYVRPAWHALVFRFDESKALPGLTCELYVRKLTDRGMKYIDVPHSTISFFDEALYRRLWGSGSWAMCMR